MAGMLLCAGVLPFVQMDVVFPVDTPPGGRYKGSTLRLMRAASEEALLEARGARKRAAQGLFPTRKTRTKRHWTAAGL
jgi:hypothetical protein